MLPLLELFDNFRIVFHFCKPCKTHRNSLKFQIPNLIAIAFKFENSKFNPEPLKGSGLPCTPLVVQGKISNPHLKS